MAKIKPEARHQAFRDDSIALLRKHAGELSSVEMLALAAHLVGQLVALQDQRKVTGAMAMEVVARNVEQGNQEAIATHLGNPLGSA
jgi:hypothetical protein